MRASRLLSGMLTAGMLASALVAALQGAGGTAYLVPAAVRAPHPRAAAAPPCQVPAPTTARQFNNMLGRVAGWQAGDGAATTMLDNGRRAWSFGDSLLADNQLHHSALVIQDRGCAASVQTASDFLPASECGDDPSTATVEAYCWGGPVAYAAGRLYMLGSQMVQVPGCTGAWCFQGVGVRLFVWVVPARGVPVLERSVPVPMTGGIFWNSAIMVSSDGTLAYVYGYRDDGDNWTFGYDTYLAVTTVADLTNVAGWTYRTADGWSPDAAGARPVVGAVGGPETSVSVYGNGASVVLTSTADGGLGHVVTEWVGTDPWGPWTTRQVADYPDTADHMWYLPLHVAGTSLHVISQNWPNRPLSDIPAHPADFRVQVF